MKKILSILLFSISIFIKAQIPNYVPSTGLVGWWPFTGNALDSSGNGNHGTINGATLTTDRFGLSNKAYSFNGNSNFISVNPSTQAFSNGISISVWAKINALNTNTNCALGCSQFLVSRSSDFSNGHFKISYSQTTVAAGGQKFGGSINSAFGVGAGNIEGTTSYPYPQTNWNHIVITYNNNQIKLYVNGILNATTNYSSPVGNVNNLIYFGRHVDATFPYFVNGQLDDIGIWSRALSACEVQALYTNTPTSTLSGNFIAQDTIKACGDSVLVAAASGLSSYTWNTGATSPSIFAKSTGWYKVTASNCLGSSGMDSVFVSIVKANILNNDTSICTVSNITLTAQQLNCSLNDLSPNLQNGLIGFWPFCGNANDISGNGNNGIVNGSTLSLDRFNRPNSCYSFNGVNNFISINHNPIFNLPNYNSFSISTWVYQNTAANTEMSILSKGQGNGGNSNDVFIYSIYNNNKLGLQLANFPNAFWTKTNDTLKINKWNHLVVTYDKIINLSKFYINGVFSGQYNYPFIPSANGDINSLFIGKQGYLCNCNYMNGKIDDISIYNRELSSSEILQLYQQSGYGSSYLWSTGDTTPTINVTPSVTTKYWVRVSNGSHFCTDTVTVTVNQPPTNLISQDTIKACGDSVLVSATSGLTSYSWSNGKTTASFFAKSTGWYKVTATNSAGCSGIDSVFVSIIKANILNNDTTICLGRSVRLNADSILGSSPLSSCAPLPANLQNGLVGYWPFCGNANDASGNGNNGITQNGVLNTNDRYLNQNSAYDFDGINDQIEVNNSISISPNQFITVNSWIYPRAFEDNKHCVSKGSHINLTYRSYGILGPENNGKARFFVSNGTIEQGVSTLTSLTLNQWYQITGVYNGSSLKIYVNGVLDNQLNFSGLINQNSEPLLFGSHKYYSLSDYWFNGKLDDIGIWNRALTPQEIQQLYSSSYPQSYLWSTGDTTPTINVTPSVTTKYWVRVSNGSHFCTDTVTVTVSQPPTNLISQDTIKACGDSVLVSATSGLSSYSWSNGKTTASFFAKSTGWYKVTATNSAGCSGMDSVFVSIIKANILNNDTTICLGRSVRLNADSILGSSPLSSCAPLPANLQNGLVGYWPFCGNANDASGNGNNGTVNGAILTSDRFGNQNKAYNFNGVNQNIEVANSNSLNPLEITISVWIYPLTNDVCIISKNDPSNATAKSFRLSHQDFWQNQHGLSTRYGSVSCNVQNEAGFYGSQGSISNNTWSHIVTTVSVSGMVNHYLNGVFLESNQSVPMVPCNNTISTMRIGGLYWNGEPNWFNGKIDDICIWNRALTPQEIQQLYTPAYPQSYLWSTGDTTPTINVTPSVTTKYWVRVSNGSHFCTDTVTVTVNQPPTNLISQDTIKACGDSVLISATSGLTSYSWSNGKTTASFFAKSTGWYKVTATNSAGCSGMDSVFVSIIKANILNNDTTICLGRSVRLNADSILGSSPLSSCAPLPANLQNGLVGYWPFCGNANDASGNGNNGTVNGIVYSQDRYGNNSSSTTFNASNLSSISVLNSNPFSFGTQSFSASFWFKSNTINGGDFISYDNCISSAGWKIRINLPSGNIGGIDVQDFDNTRIPQGVVYGSPLNNNLWHHVTFVRDVINMNYKLYINGINVLSTPISSIKNIAGSNIPFRFGNCNGFGYYTGNLDDIGIWNRALTSQEIQQLYSSSYPQSYLWSTGDTTPTINVTPSVTTKYWVRVSNGSHFCTDTVTVTVNPKTFSTINQMICQGQSFLGRSISGIYIDTLIGANSKGCDSIRTLNLTVNSRTFSTINQTICQGQSFLGRSISGTYIDTLIGANSKGCDSIRTLNLTVNPRTTSSINQTICQGQSFLGRSISGTYIDTLKNANSKGCDSIRTLNLTVNPRTFSTINQTICQGDSFLGKKSTGIYVDTLFGANSKGCDSIRTLNLFVNSSIAPIGLDSQIFCMSAQIKDLIITGNLIKWYQDSTKKIILNNNAQLSDNVTYYATQSLNNCESAIKKVKAYINTGNITSDKPNYCEGDTILLTFQSLFNKLLWFNGATTKTIKIIAQQSRSYTVDYTYRNKSCSTSINIISYPIPPKPIATSPQTYSNDNTLDDLIVTGNSLKWYEDSQLQKNIPSSTTLQNEKVYYVTQRENNCESEATAIKATLELKVLLDSIYVNNSMSPNNDQIMDAFTIENIHLAKNNKIQIANRWGEIVFEKENYQNDWYGEYLTNGYTNNTLPDGVYYYVFSFTIYGQKNEKTGYIYIKK